MYFELEGDIFSLNDNTLKLVDKFIYIGSYISSTESDLNKPIVKPLNSVDKFSILCISDRTKQGYIHTTAVFVYMYSCTT